MRDNRKIIISNHVNIPEDHTVYFVFAGIAIPAMLCVICYCCLRNKIGSWRRGSAKQCTNPRDYKAHLVYTSKYIYHYPSTEE